MWSKINKLNKLYIGSIFGWTSIGTCIGAYDFHQGNSSLDEVFGMTFAGWLIGTAQPIWIPLAPAYCLGYITHLKQKNKKIEK